MENVNWQICNTQGNIFREYALLMNPKAFREFVRFYMESDFCNREMDSNYSWFHLQPPGQSMDFIDKEIPLKTKKDWTYTTKYIYSPDIAWWIGFTYRHLALVTKLQSREIVKLIPMDVLEISYAGLHTIDDEQAVEILAARIGRVKKCGASSSKIAE